jgi:hypothetical protein
MSVVGGAKKMRQRIGLGLTLCLLTMAGLGVARAQTPPMVALPSSGNFSAQMPNGFKSITAPLPRGGTVQQFVYGWKDQAGQDNALDLGIFDIVQDGPDRPPTDLSFLLATSQRAVENRWPGALVLQHADIQSGPAQGRSFVLSIDQGRRILSAKLFYNNSQLYEVFALTTAEQQSNPAVTAFMNSFSIVR